MFSFWRSQKLLSGLGEELSGRGQGAVPPGPLPYKHVFNTLLGRSGEPVSCPWREDLLPC